MDGPLLHYVKSTVKISSIFVAFLENMNFKEKLTNSMWYVDTLGNLICFELTSQVFQCIIPLNKVALEPEMEKHYLISGLYLTQTFIVSELRV